MPQIQTVLTGHLPKPGSNARGPWLLHIFTDASGQEYKTFDAALGSKAFGLLSPPGAPSQSVTVTYSEKPARDPKYAPDRILEGVEIVVGEAVLAAVAPIQAFAPTQTVVPNDDRELRIMRQSALERALRAHAGGLVKLKDYGELILLSERLIRYFQHGPAEGQAETPNHTSEAVSEAPVAAEAAPVSGELPVGF